jgi:hypothetical protein
MNENAPHTVAIRVAYEIHELTPTGECCGTPNEAKKICLGIDGINLDDARKKIAEAIERFKSV